MEDEKIKAEKRKAFRFIILLGIVSFFADVTYEGARSISGPYLLELGAGSAVVGIVAGFGELIGYGVRFVSGYFCQKIGRLWSWANVGYVINLFAVPLLATSWSWMSASFYLILERFGKGIRVPPREAMLSYASHPIGRGLGFGLHAFFDQSGAVLGPALIALMLYFGSSMRLSFVALLLPALIALGFLARVQRQFQEPEKLEPEVKATHGPLPKAFWYTVAGISCVGCGYVDFALISYHLVKTEVVTNGIVPLYYSVVMAAVALSSLILGKLFDHFGLPVVICALIIASVASFGAFLGGATIALVAMVLWGIGYAVQSSTIAALVAKQVGPGDRAKAYGILYSLYGLSWFIGSSCLGLLYAQSLWLLVLFSFGLQLCGLIFFAKLAKRY